MVNCIVILFIFATVILDNFTLAKINKKTT